MFQMIKDWIAKNIISGGDCSPEELKECVVRYKNLKELQNSAIKVEGLLRN